MKLSALNHKDFRIYVAGNLFALNALWMQRITIGWIAWELTRSATFVGFIAFINFVPTMIMGPLFGVLIDRVRIKHAALATQSLLFVVALGFYLFFVLEILNETTLTIISALAGLIASAHNPVRMSLGPRLVEKSSVASVITIGAINFNLARLTGPALGGWLITVWGVSTALFVQTVCYLPFIIAISRLNPRQRSSSKGSPEPFRRALITGILYIVKNPFIRRIILFTTLFAFIIRGTLEILPVIADGIFSKGAIGLGILTSCAGFGALIAGMAKAIMPNQLTGHIPLTTFISALLGISLVPVVGFSNLWELTLISVALLGFVGTYSAVSMQTAIQIDLDDDLRGRVMSLWIMVSIGAAALGALIMGGLADYLGFSLTLSLTGIIGLILLMPFIFYLRK